MCIFTKNVTPTPSILWLEFAKEIFKRIYTFSFLYLLFFQIKDNHSICLASYHLSKNMCPAYFCFCLLINSFLQIKLLTYVFFENIRFFIALTKTYSSAINYNVIIQSLSYITDFFFKRVKKIKKTKD